MCLAFHFLFHNLASCTLQALNSICGTLENAKGQEGDSYLLRKPGATLPASSASSALCCLALGPRSVCGQRAAVTVCVKAPSCRQAASRAASRRTVSSRANVGWFPWGLERPHPLDQVGETGAQSKHQDPARRPPSPFLKLIQGFRHFSLPPSHPPTGRQWELKE